MSEHRVSPIIPSAPLHWRVRVCRWLWHGLGFVWGTLIVGVLIATIANLNTTTTDTPLAKLFIVHLAQTYPLQVWSSSGLLITLTLLSRLGSRTEQIALARPLSKQDRVHMLRRVGRGYSFVHRLLLDYFADLVAQTPLSEPTVFEHRDLQTLLARRAAQTKSTSVQTKAGHPRKK